MKIYLDMDDVVADWMQRAFEITGYRWAYGERIPQDRWLLLTTNERFYIDLPLKEGAHDLVNYCKSLVDQGKADSLQFLSALPHDHTVPFAAQDKVWWANKHFPGIPVFLGPYSYDKWRHCREGDILIDDRHSNCTEWRSAGGLAHEYRSWSECKVWLEEVFNNETVIS